MDKSEKQFVVSASACMGECLSVSMFDVCVCVCVCMCICVLCVCWYMCVRVFILSTRRRPLIAAFLPTVEKAKVKSFHCHIDIKLDIITNL